MDLVSRKCIRGMIFANFRTMSEKFKNEMANYYQQLKQGDSKYSYSYKECSKDDCTNN